jgi:DNA integrity scanning protein DisA with diadenylate cyclase activity
MKTNIKSLITAVCALAFCGTVQALQPEMNAALANLEEAKHSRHPIEHLERAKHDLEDARHNKHGERVEAIHQINDAILAANEHHHEAMHEHIERAIHEIREGEHLARRR